MTYPWPLGVREPLYSATAPRQTVSLTLNSELYQLCKSAGVNASRIAEAALAQELERLRREALLADVQRDIAATDAYVEKHGSFAEHVRRHYKSDDGA